MTVRDGGGLSSSVSTTVTVQRNLNTPAFVDVGNSGYSVNVDNNIPTGRTVYDAQATDGDTNTVVSYLGLSVCVCVSGGGWGICVRVCVTIIETSF